MGRPGRRVVPLASLIVFGATNVLAGPPAFADDSSAAFTYSGAWTAVTQTAPFQGGTAHQSTSPGASVTLYFKGDKVELIGSAAGSYSIAIDGQTPTSFPKSTGDDLFLQGGLALTSHSLVLTLIDGSLLSFDAANVFFHSSTGLTPVVSLPPASSTSSTSSSTTTRSSTTTSSTATRFSSIVKPSSSSTSSLSTPVLGTTSAQLNDNVAHTSQAGSIAGGIIGGLIALAALLCLLYFCRRARKRKVEREGYWDSGPGRPTSGGAFVVGGAPVHSPAMAGNERQRWSMGRAAPAMSNGGVDQSPSAQAGGWRSYMPGSGWGYKPDRLAETRAFYQVAAPPPEPVGFLPPPTPPPTVPLPTIPAATSVAEMAQVPSSRRALPTSSQNLARASMPLPARVSSPQRGPLPSAPNNTGTSNPARPQSHPPQSAFNPTPPSILPSSMRAGHLRRRTGSSEMTQVSSLAPSIPESSKAKHRSSKEALAFQLLSSAAEKKKKAKRTSYASQDDYYSRVQERTKALSGSGPGLLETLVEPALPDVPEKPEAQPKPEKFWVGREDNISRYAIADRDPRKQHSGNGSASSVSMEQQWSSSADGMSSISDDNSQEHILDSMNRKGKGKGSQ